MIKINLISNEDKESLKWEKVSRVVVSYALKIIIIQMFFVISLTIAIIYLNFEKENAKNELLSVESTKETLEIKKMEDSLKKYEKNLKVVTSVHQNHIRWISVIDSFTLLVTKGIRINTLRFKPFERIVKGKERASNKVAIESDKYMLEVQGSALKREDLIVFENTLNEAKIFRMIETDEPAYNKYVNSENISFKFNLEVERQDLAKISQE